VCAIIIIIAIVGDVLFSYSLSLPLSLKITSRIRVLFIYRYSIHWSLILRGYIVVGRRRTVHFRQDITYMFHIVRIISTDHVHELSSLKSTNIAEIVIALQAGDITNIVSRVIFESWYWFGYVN